MKPRIFCVETGGTFASIQSDGGKRPWLTLYDLLQKEIPEAFDFAELIMPKRDDPHHFGKLIDSSNAQPEDWIKLAQIAYANLSKYDGILITSGTDTMAYAASALSLVLQHPNKPIVFTGSQRTFDEPGSDAKLNFLDALVATRSAQPDVYIAFGGYLLKGKSASKIHTRNLTAFGSVNDHAVASIDRSTRSLIYNNDSDRKQEIYQTSQLDTSFDNRVKVEYLIPGYDPAWLKATLLRDDVQVVVLNVFGLGGIPTLGSRSLLPIISEYAQRKPIVAITQCPQGETDLAEYEVGKKALELGVLSANELRNRSRAPAYH